MRIRDVMKPDPLTVDAKDPLHLARSMMAWSGGRHLPVLRERQLVGILSERDILVYRAEVGPRSDWLNTPVEVAMRPDPETAGPDDAVTEAAGRMAAHKIGALPVTVLGELVGLVTITDILAAEVRASLEPTPRSQASAGDAMTPDPRTAHPDDYLLDAAARLQKYRVRHLPVVDGQGRIVGILSDRDIRAAIGDPGQALESDETGLRIQALRVKDAMTRGVMTATMADPISDLVRYFVRHDVSALPVVDEGGKVVGILSYVDVLRALTA